MIIHLRLYGVFKSAVGSDRIELDFSSSNPTVRSALAQMFSRAEYSGLRNLILDAESSDPRPSTLILVDGREIGALSGMDTGLRDESELSLLPIAHGG